MDLGLANRVAIVTGSSRGIGRAIAVNLATEGVQVVVNSRYQNELDEFVAEISSSNGLDLAPIQADLTNKDDITRLVTETVKKFGRLDILVNNTGGPPPMSFLETSQTDWYGAVNLLLMSVINCCKEAFSHMKKQRWGRIINMTSVAAKQPLKRLVLSNAIRAGIIGLTKTMSNEFAEYEILVNTVCPGWTLTRRIEELARSRRIETGMSYDEIISELSSNIPLQRLATPDEIANLVVFLSSEKASYITGTSIPVDGGFLKSS